MSEEASISSDFLVSLIRYSLSVPGAPGLVGGASGISFSGIGLGVAGWEIFFLGHPGRRASLFGPNLQANALLWTLGLCTCLIPFCCSDWVESPGSSLRWLGPSLLPSLPCCPGLRGNVGLQIKGGNAREGRQEGSKKGSHCSITGCDVRLPGFYIHDWPAQHLMCKAQCLVCGKHYTKMCQVAIDHVLFFFHSWESKGGKYLPHLLPLLCVGARTTST